MFHPLRSALLARLAGARARSAERWQGASDNLRGSLLLLGSIVCFAGVTALTKEVGSRISIFEILVVRQIVMQILLAPIVFAHFPAVLRTRHLGLQILRGLLSLGSMLAGLTAILHIPLADATAIGFTQVLIVTAIAPLVLKEQAGLHRWAAALIGFTGVLLMLRPTAGVDPYALLALAGAVCNAGITLTVRVLAGADRTETIMTYQALVLFVTCAIPTYLFWETPTLSDLALMIMIGVAGTVGGWLFTRALQLGEASALAPLDFVRLLLVTAIGFVIFGELPSPAAMLGGCIVLGAAVYTIRRNARRRTRS